jgi:hypothetical protein
VLTREAKMPHETELSGPMQRLFQRQTFQFDDPESLERLCVDARKIIERKLIERLVSLVFRNKPDVVAP